MPAVLRKLMRHANVQTTMQYYVDLDVDEMADDLWAKHPATVGENLRPVTFPVTSARKRKVGPAADIALTSNGD